MIISRVWAMPNKWTFTIKPIKEILKKYVGNGKNWIDPFSGKYSPAEITNDLNLKMPTIYHMKALEFCKMVNGKYNGVLFDPPYSLRQIKECYENIGIKLNYKETINPAFAEEKNLLAPKIKMEGYAISFGWNSIGFSKKRGFEIIEILLICHGRGHNDTICTIEQKKWHQNKLNF